MDSFTFSRFMQSARGFIVEIAEIRNGIVYFRCEDNLGWGLAYLNDFIEVARQYELKNLG